MSANSKIEWTDHTFNPWIGCTKVSIAATGGGGCDGCYAEVSTPVRVLRGKGTETWGAKAQRVRTSAANWALPKRWNAQADAFYAQHGRRQRVFCASLADVFDNAVPAAWRADLFRLIRSTPNLDWLLLTKRIGNAREMIDAALDADALGPTWPWKNVWLGATIVNQVEADRDIPKLLDVPAARRFLSMEPLLGPVDLAAHVAPPPLPFLRSGTPLCNDLPCNVGCARKGRPHYPGEYGCRWSKIDNGGSLPALDWVIVGGESGPSARPMHPDWARSLRDQCQVAGVPFLFKQWGEWTAHDVDPNGASSHLCCIDRNGGECALSRGANMRERGEPWWHLPPHPGRGTWGPDGIPAGVVEVRRIGKKAAGRLLDGRTWDQFPGEACNA